MRSEENTQEDNYLKYINNTADSEIHQRIDNLRILTAKTGNLLTNKERILIREELFKLEHQKKFTRTQRTRAIAYLINSANTLNNKEKYQLSEYHDHNYFGIKDIEHLYNDRIDEYYKPILARSSFEHNYKEYDIRGDKNKNMLLKHYLYTITPQLTELINEKKGSTQNEQKVQLTIAIVFRHVTNPTKNVLFTLKAKT